MLTPATRSIVTPAAVSSSSTPMCENARAPPPDSTIPTERAGQPPGDAGEVGAELGLPDQVRPGRIEHGRPAGQCAGPRRRKRPGRSRAARDTAKHRRDRSACRSPRGSGRPAGGRTSSTGSCEDGSADEQDQVVACLRPVEQRSVHGGRLRRHRLRPAPLDRRAAVTEQVSLQGGASRVASRRQRDPSVERDERDRRRPWPGRGRRRARVCAQLLAERPVQGRDSAGEPCRSSSKSAWSTAMQIGGAARRGPTPTRGESVSSASSPSASPRP